MRDATIQTDRSHRHGPAASRQADGAEPGHGRDAASPLSIPLRGWKDILLRLKDQVTADHIALVAAGVAFYGLLAIFPAITALMALTGLIYEPAELVGALESISAIVPTQAADILLGQAQDVAGSGGRGLTLGLILSLGFAIWSASAGVGSLMEGINLAYDEEETRGFIRRKLVTIAMTLAMMVGVMLAAAFVLVVPVVLSFLAFAPWMETAIRLVSYLPAAAIVIFGLGVLYRVGPDRDPAGARWVTAGSVIGCAVWLAASIGFSIYVTNFGSYNETFGSLGGGVVMLMWMWISAFVILLGAELNSEIEAQTARDTTTGSNDPMGRRGAVKADTLGETS